MVCSHLVLLPVVVFLVVGSIHLFSMILQDLQNQREFDTFTSLYNKPYARYHRHGDNRNADNADDDHRNNRNQHNDNDRSMEFFRRFRNFENALQHTETLNAQRSHDDSAIYGVNQFADLTAEEFHASMLNVKRKTGKFARPRAISFDSMMQQQKQLRQTPSSSRQQRSVTAASAAATDEAALPDYFNWAELGRVSDVRNQGRCGACWAHSVIETVESMAAIEHNYTIGAVRPLSVQQMIDCSTNNRGCAGGDTCTLLQWLVLNDVPIASENSYPLNVANGQNACSVASVAEAAKSGVVRVRLFTCENLAHQEQRMVEYLANVGPITAAVDAISWQYYLGGVIQHHCGDGAPSSLNHAVQIVGYDRRGELPHWIVRNSWGNRFGDGGFVKIQMGGNVCGIALQVSAILVM